MQNGRLNLNFNMYLLLGCETEVYFSLSLNSYQTGLDIIRLLALLFCVWQ